MPQEKDATLIKQIIFEPKSTVTDWVAYKDTYSVKVTLSLAIPYFTENVLTEEKQRVFFFFNRALLF